jgi:hypothetical protein
MANALSGAEWKKVLKDHKDAPDTDGVTKALDAYDKVEPKVKDAPQPVLDALEKLVDVAKSAKSANAKDKKRKPVVEFLDDVLKDAATMKVKAERFLQEKTERDREGEDTDEGGDDERAKLTERLFKVKKLDAENAKPFALALGGKSHGLVIAKTGALTGDHTKRARKMREGKGRIFTGHVFGEGGKYVFLLQEKPPGGLAKAIKKTAKKHTELPPIRVIIRGPDGFELDDENDVDEMTDLGEDPGEEPTGDSEVADVRTDDRGAFKERLASVKARFDALKAADPARARSIAGLLMQAGSLAQVNDFEGAGLRLDEVERQLGPSDTSPSETPNASKSGLEDPHKSAWENEIAELEPDYQAALRRDPAKAGTLRGIWSFATEKGEAGEFARALEALKRLRGLLSAESALKPAPDLSAWSAAREQVIAQLRKAASGFATNKNPFARDAIIEIQSIIANLTAKPDTPQAVAELRRYLEQDDLIDDAENIPKDIATVVIRDPLLAALNALKV